MADPSTYRPATGDIPTTPGVYRFIDTEGRVIYVGKAKNLRNRLTSYFQDTARLRPRTQQMVLTAAAVKWVVVASEVEALTLEYSWIKEFSPRFNVVFRDDKSYPYLAVTLAEDFPRAFVTRESRRQGVRYYGPYTHVWAIRQSLDELLKVFPIRTCKNTVFKRAKRQQRPCLLGYIDKCSAPCVGRIDSDEYRLIARELCRFMEGHTGEIIAHHRKKMTVAASQLKFEEAAQHRNAITALTKVLEKNAVVLPDNTDADIFGIEADDIEAAVQVFNVRAGRVRGVRGWAVERVNDADIPSLISSLLEQVYSIAEPRRMRRSAKSIDDIEHEAASVIPPEILVPELPPNKDVIESWLSELRGSKVLLRVPQRGAKKDLAATVATNAKEALRLYKSKRVSDLTQRGAALEQLQEYLGLESAPLRIECYDISHTSGSERVGSMVVFEDGAPRKSEYRRFVIRGEGYEHADDTAAMAEVLERRFQRIDNTVEPGESGLLDEQNKPRRFAYKPDLLVVDGGLPQVNAVQAVVDRLGISVHVVGLAKRLEELWVSGESFPVILPRRSPALYMLQFLRDESHRFAITHHRQRRAAAMQKSVLDDIPGLGPARQRDLLKQFKSVKRICAASLEELTEVPGIGSAIAENIVNHLHDKS